MYSGRNRVSSWLAAAATFLVVVTVVAVADSFAAPSPRQSAAVSLSQTPR